MKLNKTGYSLCGSAFVNTDNAHYEISYKEINSSNTTKLNNVVVEVYEKVESDNETDKGVKIGTLAMEFGKLNVSEFPMTSEAPSYLSDFTAIIAELNNENVESNEEEK